MTLIDVNLLLNAHDSDSIHHEAARIWLENTFSEPAAVGLPWAAILGFLRISTNLRLCPNGPSLAEAIAVVAGWLDQPLVTILHPGERHWEILRRLLVEWQAPGPLVMDAHLAALAIEHGATLATADRDFSRFPGLRVVNPLSPHP